MIDYFALALGHALLVLAFMRLVLRDSLDIDPAIAQLQEEGEARRSYSEGADAKDPLPSADGRAPQTRRDHNPARQSLSAQKAARRASGSSAIGDGAETP